MGKLTRPDAAGKDYEIIIADVSRITAKQPYYSLMVIHKTDATKGYWPRSTFTEAEAIAEAKKRGIKIIREVLGAKTVRTIKVNPMSKRNPTYKDMLRIARQRIKAKDYMGAHEAITASGANMIDIQEFFTKAEMKAMARWANQRVGATPKRKKKNPDYKAKRGMVEAIISVNGYYDRPGSKVVRRITGSTFLSAAHAARAWIQDKVAGRMYYVVLVDDQGSPIDHMQTYGSKYRRNPSKKISGSKKMASLILQWHGGQSDPLYAVGSSWLAGRSVDDTLVENALFNIRQDLMAQRYSKIGMAQAKNMGPDEYAMRKQEQKELRVINKYLEDKMGIKENPAEYIIAGYKHNGPYNIQLRQAAGKKTYKLVIFHNKVPIAEKRGISSLADGLRRLTTKVRSLERRGEAKFRKTNWPI